MFVSCGEDLLYQKSLKRDAISDFSQVNKQEQYVKEAEELWRDVNSPITALSYDAAWVLVNAFLKTEKLNRTSLKDTLNKLAKKEVTFPNVPNGTTGAITFDINGNRDNLEGLLVKVEKDTNPNSKTGLKFVPIN